MTELLRGLGLAPDWVRRGDAVVTLSRDGTWAVTDRALHDLTTPRLPAVGDLGWIAVGDDQWPVPVGPAGAATVGDAVAGAAWWLAGIQEAAVTARDEHGRIPFDATLQARLVGRPGGPLRPPVDAVRGLVADLLRRRGIDVPRRTWGGAAWSVALTHDLDAVRTRRARAAVGDVLRGRPGDAARRAFGPDRRRQSVADLRRVADHHDAAATWFVKPGAWSRHDVPGGLDAELVRRLKSWVGDGHEVGWHPGYGAHDRSDRLKIEADRFKLALGHAPRLARTHFLRWDDATPARLAAHGVRVDSTLGWSRQPGFRRGTTHPFQIWDPAVGAASDVWEMPLAIMDTTLAAHQGLGPDAVADALRQTFQTARAAGGVAVVLWHNQIDADTAGWTARLDALDREIGQARRNGAAVGPIESLLERWRADS